jgi:hypothetical protein
MNKKNIFKQSTGTKTEFLITESSKRSEGNADSSVCEFNLPFDVYIETQIANVITNGDVAYTDSLGENFFNGDSLFYRVKINNQTETYSCSISGLGFISLSSECVTSTPTIETSTISSESSSVNSGICAFILDTPIYLQTLVSGVIDTSTLVYNEPSGTTLFNGFNKYYKVKINSEADSFNVRINNGEVIEISPCI